jgi:hypothetical protein
VWDVLYFQSIAFLFLYLENSRYELGAEDGAIFRGAL